MTEHPSPDNPRHDPSSSAADSSDAARDKRDKRDKNDVAPLNPFPDQRDLYVIVAGALLGLVLSQAVLGAIAPSLYQRLFVGGAEEQQTLEQAFMREGEALRRLEDTGVSESEVEAQRQRLDEAMAPYRAALLQARADHMDWLRGRMMGLVLAVVVMMLLEAVVSPQVKPGRSVVVPRALNRLITIRYALIAVWVAVIIAQPAVLAHMPFVFCVLLIAVAMLVAFVPLGRRAPRGRGG